MIQYEEDWIITLLFHRTGNGPMIRALLFAVPCALLTLLLCLLDDWMPELKEDMNLLILDKSTLWPATTAVLGLLLGFRTNRAMARFWEGTGLLHQMRGEWFDSISCCVTFSVGAVATKKDEVMAFRHTAVRLMSLCHGSALEEIAGDTGEEVETIDPFGLDTATLTHLHKCKEEYHFNRVEVLLHLTQSIITQALENGILKIPPPILSRVYQTLSRGFVNLLNAKKIADTRFPFPYAQLITILIFLHTVFLPVFMSAVVPHKFWAPVLAFLPMFSMCAVNFIGVELENPFGKDANDLPLDHFQGEMNKCLMMLLHDSADLIANVSPNRCITNFENLTSTLASRRDQYGHDEEQTSRHDSLSQFVSHLQATAHKPNRRLCVGAQNRGEERPDPLIDMDLAAKDTVAPGSSVTASPIGTRAPGSSVVASAAGSVASAKSTKSKRRDAASIHTTKSQAPMPTPPQSPREAQAPVVEQKETTEPKALSAASRSLLTDFNVELPMLKTLVEAQVRELNQSIRALKDFSNTLPGVVDFMLANKVGSDYQSSWSKDKNQLMSSLVLQGPVTPTGSRSRSRDGHDVVAPVVASLGAPVRSFSPKPPYAASSAPLRPPDDFPLSPRDSSREQSEVIIGRV